MANQYINAMTALWNSAGTTYSAIKINVTNAASAAASKLLELQVGASDKFTVDKAGAVVAAGSITSAGVVSTSAMVPVSNDGAALGQPLQSWSDLYLATGGVINWATSDVTITHSSNTLSFSGASSGYFFDAVVKPAANDGSALGETATAWSDLFLASGSVINFANDVTLTHSADFLTVAGGDLRMTTAGTNAASVVTVGGTQTLTGKTLTSPTITGTGTIASGAITSSGVVKATSSFESTTTTVNLAPSAAGTINLRPGGPADTAQQTSLNSSGDMSIAGSCTLAGSIIGTGVIASRAPSGNVHFWLYGPNNEDRAVIYTDAATSASLNIRVIGVYTWVFGNDGHLSLPGGLNSGVGIRSRTGSSGFYSNFWYHFHYDAAGHNYVFVDNTNFGWMTLNSDYRGKTDVQPLGSKWDVVKALRPISFKWKDWSEPWGADGGMQQLMGASDEQQWGFIAHELQETLVSSASSGVKDQKNLVQSPNPMPVIAALTAALQEAMARIEALEGK